MNHLNRVITRIGAVALLIVLHPSQQVPGITKEQAPVRSPNRPLMFGGCGGVYFLAEPGELEIAVVKRDRNRSSRHTQLRAILVGPDRQLVQEKIIPDDGQPSGSGLGPPQWVRFRTQVEYKGVYALNITVSRDRYGQRMIWGFRTNCPKYIIETARGHKDERHQEPIVLASPERPVDVAFRPRTGAFEFEVSGLRDQVASLRLSRADGSVVTEIAVRDGAATASVSAQKRRGAMPWRLHLPSAEATINLEGLTRWQPGDLSEDMCLWTPDPSSWFPGAKMYTWHGVKPRIPTRPETRSPGCRRMR